MELDCVRWRMVEDDVDRMDIDDVDSAEAEVDPVDQIHIRLEINHK